MIADAVTIIGTQDIVFGEIDRWATHMLSTQALKKLIRLLQKYPSGKTICCYGLRLL